MSEKSSKTKSPRNARKFASLLVLGFMGATTLLGFQNCTGSFSSSLSSVAPSVLAHPTSARDANSALGSSTQVATDNYVEVRSQPNQYYYNYAPDVIYFNGMYHMYWCAGVGAAGDYVLHAQSPNSYGPFHASNNGTNFTYDVSLSPTLNSANFDGYETCDPSVMQVNGTFYLYYGGLATQSNSTSTTKIGVATSSDGIHFARANGGNPIVTPVSGAFNTYGAGQPAVFYIAPYYYMSFTDSTGPGGNGQYMLRSLDPLFQNGDQELVGPRNWANRNPLARSGQFMYLGAFSIDIAYDPMSGKLFIPSDQEEGITRVYIFDPTTFNNLGYLSVNGTWADGASIAKNPDRTMLNRSSCASVDVNLFKGDSPSGNYNSVVNGTDWNISRSEAQFQLSSSLCAPILPAPSVPVTKASSSIPGTFYSSPFTLAVGQSVPFGTGGSFVMQSDGNLVMYQYGVALWAASFSSSLDGQPVAGRACSSQCFAAFQGDGNLVLYGPGGAYWASAAHGLSGSTLELTATAPYIQFLQNDTTAVGTFTLGAGQSIPFGSSQLVMQSDGNLVLYHNGAALWATSFSSSLDGNPVAGRSCAQCIATLQSDGNLVLYGPSGAYWASGTSGYPGATLQLSAATPHLQILSNGVPLYNDLGARAMRPFSLSAGQSISYGSSQLAMQADGNLVIYQNGIAVWAASSLSSLDGKPTAGRSCAQCSASFQSDGNVVLYGPSGAYWATMSSASQPMFELNHSAPYISVISN